MSRAIFINVPVNDLERAKTFFAELGFGYDPQFTDQKAACMIIGEDVAYAMLLQHAFFQTFTDQAVCETGATEALIGISAQSREEVDQLVDKALELGATEVLEPQDHGFMYSRAFRDLDGHHWELIWMDVEAAKEAMSA